MVRQGVAGPPASRRREVRAALAVVLAVLLVSAIGGVVWAVLAPTERVVVVQPGRGAALTGESGHRFDAMALFVCVAMVVGVLTAAAVWRLRRVRGPIMQCALLFASLVGAELMSWFGELVARWMHPHSSNPPLHTIVAMPPPVDGWRNLVDHWIHSDLSAGAWTVVLVQPLFAALVILLVAALSTSEDLGVGPVHPAYTSEISYGPYSTPVANGISLGQTGPYEGADSR
ncbi:DUF2567 domain-containing protein [Nocardia jiangxiensis]|uniref:DUF2567 domain-containing protein n=1 Tax=Nocardia jiangxiensis TaxID=282685 RepID=A0ABW6S235_9NOCA|nr:DUF2567 domain-containing protein [Nocardia jiangxiensis]